MLLKEQYERNVFPTREEKLAIAHDLGLHVMVVNNWFQNKRARNRDCMSTEKGMN